MARREFVGLLCILVGALGVTTLVDAQCEAHLTASDSSINDLFGRAVAISGNLAVVGAPLNDDAGSASGAAYVFRFNGTMWYQEAKLTAWDAASGAEFGRAVAITDDMIVVGAPFDDASTGAVYVYRNNGSSWIGTWKILASDAVSSGEFGTSLAASGNVIVVGTPMPPSAFGRAYVYRYGGSGWVSDQILTPSGSAFQDNFGSSVAVSGDTIVVGAHLCCWSGVEHGPGSAYVFEYNGASWSEEQVLTADDGEIGDHFGESVSVSGDLIAVGAPHDQDFGPETGAAYLFRRTSSSWLQEHKLVGTFAFDRFGESVSVDGGYLGIGAPSASGPDSSGRAYLYRDGGAVWDLERDLGDDAFAFDSFGGAVAVSAGCLLVGSLHGDDGTEWDTGAADTFGRPATTTFRNGDFSEGAPLGMDGDPWCFVDQSDNGAADYSSGPGAVVTGGDDLASGSTNTVIEQAFDLHTESDYRVAFEWAYESADLAGFDGAFYDLIDVTTGGSVIGGPITLSDVPGTFGTVDKAFSGSGRYILRLGTFSTDNCCGAGTTQFDDITIHCDEPAGPLTNGDFSDASGTPWCFTDTSRNGAADFIDDEAIVIGGSNGLLVAGETCIEQEISIAAGSQTCSFAWSYASSDAPGFDTAIWDLIDLTTNLSVVGGPLVLSDTDGESGNVAMSFTGSGLYRLRLGVTTVDNLFGPGIATFDDVMIGLSSPLFIRGDSNADSSFDIGDSVFLLDFLFSPGSLTPPCMDSADANDDGTVNVGDPVTVLDRLFAGGAPIPAPHPFCGPDPTVDLLGCTSYSPCP